MSSSCWPVLGLPGMIEAWCRSPPRHFDRVDADTGVASEGDASHSTFGGFGVSWPARGCSSSRNLDEFRNHPLVFLSSVYVDSVIGYRWPELGYTQKVIGACCRTPLWHRIITTQTSGCQGHPSECGAIYAQLS